MASAHNLVFVVSIVAGVVSGALWFWSATVPIPSEPIRFQAFAGAGGANADVEKLMRALRWQSTLNKWAAIAAAIATLTQGGLTLV